MIVTLTTGPVHARVPLHENPHLDDASRAVLGDGTVLIDRLARTAGEAAIVDGFLELDLPAHAIAIWTPAGRP